MRTGPRSPGSWEPSGARPRPQPHPTRPPLPTPLTPAAPRLEQGGGSRTAWGRPSAHLSRAPAPRPPGAVMPVSQAEELRQSPDSNPRSLDCAPNLWPRGNGLGGGRRSDKGLRAGVGFLCGLRAQSRLPRPEGALRAGCVHTCRAWVSLPSSRLHVYSCGASCLRKGRPCSGVRDPVNPLLGQARTFLAPKDTPTALPRAGWSISRLGIHRGQSGCSGVGQCGVGCEASGHPEPWSARRASWLPCPERLCACPGEGAGPGLARLGCSAALCRGSGRGAVTGEVRTWLCRKMTASLLCPHSA